MQDPEHSPKHPTTSTSPEAPSSRWTQPDPINKPGYWVRPIDPEVLERMPDFCETFLDMTPWKLFVRDVKGLWRFFGF